MQVASFDFQNAVEPPRNVKTQCVATQSFGTFEVGGGKPTRIREGVFEFIAVKLRLCGGQNWLKIGQFYFGDAVQLVIHLLPFKLQLFFILDVLPLATATNPKMLAKRRSPFVRKRVRLQDAAFRKFLFVIKNLYVHHVAWGYVSVNKNHRPVHPREALSFGGEIFD